MSNYRDRILGFEKIENHKLQVHPKNFRLHGVEQRGAMEDLLSVVGVAGAAVAYNSERYGGLTLIDGHLRKEILEEMPVLILDVTDEEADLILASYDRVGNMANVDKVMFQELAQSLEAMIGGAEHLQRMLEVECNTTAGDVEEEIEYEQSPIYPVVADVDEAYDMVMIFCTRGIHFTILSTLLELPKVQEPRKARGTVGLTRVIPFEFFMDWYYKTTGKKPPSKDKINVYAAPEPELFNLEIPTLAEA